ncbi:MAG: hypothetical protein ACRDRW_20250 [Pseudonocardiaceae bacterium]
MPAPGGRPAHLHPTPAPEVTHPMMPAHDPDTAESCPGCAATIGVRGTASTPPQVQAWSCAACGMDWAMTVVNPHLRATYPAGLATAVEEIGRLRWTLRQVITLADDALTITERQLRDRLLTLASHAR